MPLYNYKLLRVKDVEKHSLTLEIGNVLYIYIKFIFIIKFKFTYNLYINIYKHIYLPQEQLNTGIATFAIDI